MPAAQTVLAGLSALSNDWRPLAIGWHVALGFLVVALAAGWRPALAVVRGFVALMLASVGALAWASGNPFNGGVFSALALWVALSGWRTSRRPVEFSSPPLIIAGVLLIAFGALYPHFLLASSSLEYVWAAPLGLIPCPTLSAVVGLALMLGLLGSRGSSAVLTAAALFYGAIGVFRLEVNLDVWLLAGGAILGGAVARAIVRGNLVGMPGFEPGTP